MTTLSLRHLSKDEAAAVRRAARMSAVDCLPPEWRELVHEYGFTIVTALRNCGVLKAKHGRHIIETMLSELSATRGTASCQGVRPNVVSVPHEPSDAMIEASMATVAGFNVACTKREKHRLRLKAAINAELAAQRGHRAKGRA